MNQLSRKNACCLFFLAMLMFASLAEAAALETTSSSAASFDVISIRVSQHDGGGDRQEFRSDGYFAKNVSFSTLLARAYDIKSERLVSGLPKWTDAKRFDIQAKWSLALMTAMGSLPTEQQNGLQRQLLQSLLADRFRLRVVSSQKSIPVYALVPTKSLSRASKPKPELVKDETGSGGGLTVTAHQIVGKAATMGLLADNLYFYYGELVVDKSGFRGNYDFTLDTPPRGNDDSIPIDGRAELEAALREQLGLEVKLEKVTLPSVTILHVERPSEN